MSRRIQIVALNVAVILGGAGVANAQYSGANYVRQQPIATDQVQAAVRTLLVQVDHLVEDLEVDLVRDPASERLMAAAREVQDEVEHLAASSENGVDYNHAVRDFQAFDAEWHRLTRMALRYAVNDRHLQRNLARVSQTDAELHRLLRVSVPVDVQEVRLLTTGLRRAVEHLREDIETDLSGLRQQPAIEERAAMLEESAEHLEASIVRGVDVNHLREDFQAVEETWLQLAASLRGLSPMRFDHVLRATNVVATSEGQLRAALGFEPNPEQFTCFRPAPSDVRSRLPYYSTRTPVTLPSGWRVVPVTPAPRPQLPPTRFQPEPDPAEAGVSLWLGFLFGGDNDAQRPARPMRKAVVELNNESATHDHELDRTPPTIKKVATPAPATQVPAQATAPPKPIAPAVQAKIDKNFAKLQTKDRTTAAAQRICPVSRELLGTHGAPIKVSVKDESGVRREVFVCCEDCEEKLDEHPNRFLKNLPD